MDFTVRTLERQAATGDARAIARLTHIRDSLQRVLKPCIHLCPISIGTLGNGWPSKCRPRKIMRGKYVSIYFDLGPWQDAPIIATRYSDGQPLSNDFFIRRFKKYTRTS